MARGKLSNKSQPFWKSILAKPKIKFICSSKNFCKVQPPYPRQYIATEHKIACTVSALFPFLLGGNFQFNILKRQALQKE